MKKRFDKRHLILLFTAVLVVSLFAIVACSPSGDEAEGDGAEAASSNEMTQIVSADEADPSSLIAVPTHPEGTFTEDNVQSEAVCSTCHTQEDLVANGEGLLVDPDAGTVANPHSNHQYLECYDCHSVGGQSVLYCNSCHEFALPEGWANPEEGGAELGYEFDVSNSELCTYAESGRDVEPLPEGATDGQADLQDQAFMQDMMIWFGSMMGATTENPEADQG